MFKVVYIYLYHVYIGHSPLEVLLPQIPLLPGRVGLDRVHDRQLQVPVEHRTTVCTVLQPYTLHGRVGPREASRDHELLDDRTWCRTRRVTSTEH
jgi:hypothetical protein